MGTTELALRILVMDDVSEVRQTVKGFLASDGYYADEAGTTRELIKRMAEKPYDLILLDIVLANEISIDQALELVQEAFPDVAIPHDEVLEDLGLGSRATVSGLYLLPVIKAISPQSKVIMLTAAWEGESDEQYLRKWGYEVTILKCGEDREFTPGANLYGLGAEIRGFVDRMAKDLGRSR